MAKHYLEGDLMGNFCSGTLSNVLVFFSWYIGIPKCAGAFWKRFYYCYTIQIDSHFYQKLLLGMILLLDKINYKLVAVVSDRD